LHTVLSVEVSILTGFLQSRAAISLESTVPVLGIAVHVHPNRNKIDKITISLIL